jgi:septum formation protein
VAPRPPLVLASTSPRRAALLRQLALPFTVVAPDVDETPHPDEAPDAMVLRLARAKAAVVAAGAVDALVIAADTTVVLDGDVLGKPRDALEAAEFLTRLAGRSHVVHTGHALCWGAREAAAVRSTTVTFRPLSAREIAAHAASGEGLDKAGGYGIQGIGAAFVEEIHGCHGAVVGLSPATLCVLALRLGVDLV